MGAKTRRIDANIAKLPLPARRFPPPWSIEELDACYVVRDYSGSTKSRLS